MQYFWEGDMPWGKVKKIYVDKEDREAVETVQEITAQLRKRNIDIEVYEFPAAMFREGLKETEVRQAGDGEEKIAFVRNSLHEGKEGKV